MLERVGFLHEYFEAVVAAAFRQTLCLQPADRALDEHRVSGKPWDDHLERPHDLHLERVVVARRCLAYVNEQRQPVVVATTSRPL